MGLGGRLRGKPRGGTKPRPYRVGGEKLGLLLDVGVGVRARVRVRVRVRVRDGLR